MSLGAGAPDAVEVPQPREGLRRGLSSDGAVLEEEGAGDLAREAALPQQRPGLGPARCDVVIESFRWSHPLSRLLVGSRWGVFSRP